ncbi:MAG: InlB B-repeat-containing protein, partial [Defluviitaleaceae bacterium]|nr:InlB B-repeat-containing protein [Defluviitaleaceae bacterium]
QGVDIRIASVGTVGGVDYGAGNLLELAGHSSYPSDRTYKFVITVRITAGTATGRAMPPYDVWVRPASGGTGDNIGSTYLARNQTVQNGVDVIFDFELTGTQISNLISQGANVMRIGGASQNNFQVRGIVISEKIVVVAPPRTVTFNANGGTGTLAPQTINSGVATPLSANTFTRHGFVFGGWNTAANGSGTNYSDAQTVTISADLNLFAQWLRIGAVSSAGIGNVTSADVIFLARNIAGHTGVAIPNPRIANLRGANRPPHETDISLLLKWLVGYDLNYLIEQTLGE